MARRVTISTFNFHYCPVDPDGEWEPMIRQISHYLEHKINQALPDEPDLIVLPECCDMPSGLSSERLREYYLQRGDRILNLLAGIAQKHHCYIAYPSIRTMDDGSWRNSVRLIDRSSEVVGTYHKNHPVIIEMEADKVLCGKEAPIMECDFGRVACAICFDLNFNPLRLNYVKQQPDLILFPSMFHGSFMQQYWAYSCRAHLVGAIAGGLPSSIVSPVGEIVASTSSYYDFISASVNLDCVVVHLDQNRQRLDAIKQKYGKKVKISDPGYLGSVLLSSETDAFSSEDLVSEFGLERLDDYLARSLAYHQNSHFIEA
ncbi:carbon-nitrogen hydrolase family protein [Paenibacillus sp. MBLB4367]|uniref:carbon-nitrogen hydrolase family protein n=1 Tax=Paenibacillus sp. MBLB4367 TaxID=3384767 RepID=UPI00390840E0